MRMVSKKHLTGSSMKKFKRIHIHHKVYAFKRNAKEAKKEEIIEPVVEKDKEVVEQQVNEAVVNNNVDVAPKRTRKKKITETVDENTAEVIENNEEKTE